MLKLWRVYVTQDVGRKLEIEGYEGTEDEHLVFAETADDAERLCRSHIIYSYKNGSFWDDKFVTRKEVSFDKAKVVLSSFDA